MKKFTSTLILGLFLLIAMIPMQVQAAAMSNYLRNKTVDFVFRGQAFTAPTTICIALTTATPTAASTGSTISEATYGGYARGQLNPSVSNWLGTGGESAGTSNGTTGQTKNNTVITVGTQATTGPTVVTSFAVMDSCTAGAGNVLFYAPLTNAKTINAGDPAPVFSLNALTVQLN